MRCMRHCLRFRVDAVLLAILLLGGSGCRNPGNGSDAAVPDAAGTLDASPVAGLPDLARSRDLSRPLPNFPDPGDMATLSNESDMAMQPSDMAMQPSDMAAIPDLTIPPDLLPPSDMIPPYGTDASLCVSAPKPKACVPRKQIFPLQNFIFVGFAPEVVAIGDLDGDSLNDVAVTEMQPSTVGVFLNQGDGTFANAGNYGLPGGAGVWTLQIKDIDNDGLADVLVGANAYPLVVLRNHGGGVLGHWTRFNSPTLGSITLSFADLNCDGFLDVINQASFFLNRRDGTFADGVLLVPNDPINAAHSARAGDMDGDGWPDIVRQLGTNNRPVAIFSSRGGLFQTTFEDDYPGSAWLILGDLNNDDWLDLAMTSESALGDGKGHLGKPLVAPPVAYYVLDDVNRDGILDRVTEGNCGPAITLGRGDGTFDPLMEGPQGHKCGGGVFAVDDLDGDCWPDAAFMTNGGVYLFTNQHNGLFK